MVSRAAELGQPQALKCGLWLPGSGSRLTAPAAQWPLRILPSVPHPKVILLTINIRLSGKFYFNWYRLRLWSTFTDFIDRLASIRLNLCQVHFSLTTVIFYVAAFCSIFTTRTLNTCGGLWQTEALKLCNLAWPGSPDMGQLWVWCW